MGRGSAILAKDFVRLPEPDSIGAGSAGAAGLHVEEHVPPSIPPEGASSARSGSRVVAAPGGAPLRTRIPGSADGSRGRSVPSAASVRSSASEEGSPESPASPATPAATPVWSAAPSKEATGGEADAKADSRPGRSNFHHHMMQREVYSAARQALRARMASKEASSEASADAPSGPTTGVGSAGINFRAIAGVVGKGVHQALQKERLAYSVTQTVCTKRMLTKAGEIVTDVTKERSLAKVAKGLEGVLADCEALEKEYHYHVDLGELKQSIGAAVTLLKRQLQQDSEDSTVAQLQDRRFECAVALQALLPGATGPGHQSDLPCAGLDDLTLALLSPMPEATLVQLLKQIFAKPDDLPTLVAWRENLKCLGIAQEDCERIVHSVQVWARARKSDKPGAFDFDDGYKRFAQHLTQAKETMAAMAVVPMDKLEQMWATLMAYTRTDDAIQACDKHIVGLGMADKDTKHMLKSMRTWAQVKNAFLMTKGLAFDPKKLQAQYTQMARILAGGAAGGAKARPGLLVPEKARTSRQESVVAEVQRSLSHSAPKPSDGSAGGPPTQRRPSQVPSRRESVMLTMQATPSFGSRPPSQLASSRRPSMMMDTMSGSFQKQYMGTALLNPQAVGQHTVAGARRNSRMVLLEQHLNGSRPTASPMEPNNFGKALIAAMEKSNLPQHVHEGEDPQEEAGLVRLGSKQLGLPQQSKWTWSSDAASTGMDRRGESKERREMKFYMPPSLPEVEESDDHPSSGSKPSSPQVAGMWPTTSAGADGMMLPRMSGTAMRQSSKGADRRGPSKDMTVPELRIHAPRQSDLEDRDALDRTYHMPTCFPEEEETEEEETGSEMSDPPPGAPLGSVKRRPASRSPSKEEVRKKSHAGKPSASRRRESKNEDSDRGRGSPDMQGAHPRLHGAGSPDGHAFPAPPWPRDSTSRRISDLRKKIKAANLRRAGVLKDQLGRAAAVPGGDPQSDKGSTRRAHREALDWCETFLAAYETLEEAGKVTPREWTPWGPIEVSHIEDEPEAFSSHWGSTQFGLSLGSLGASAEWQTADLVTIREVLDAGGGMDKAKATYQFRDLGQRHFQDVFSLFDRLPLSDPLCVREPALWSTTTSYDAQGGWAASYAGSSKLSSAASSTWPPVRPRGTPRLGGSAGVSPRKRGPGWPQSVRAAVDLAATAR